MGYRLTKECQEILEAAKAADGKIWLHEVNGGYWLGVGKQHFGITKGEPPNRRTMRLYRDALDYLVSIGFVVYASGIVWELTTRGWEGDLSDLSIADESSDYLEMADHLEDKGYHLPAVMVAGAVLEDFLRRLHLTRIGPWPEDSGSNLNLLNEALRKAGVYELPVSRQVQAWADIRNLADHGHFDRVELTSVRPMIEGIANFIGQHGG
jgi:hypothetical protein